LAPPRRRQHPWSPLRPTSPDVADSLPPEGCGTWAAARPPQPQKSGPCCRVPRLPAPPRFFRFPLRFAAVRAPLIRPPRRCASGG
jgi:hypothetical protein